MSKLLCFAAPVIPGKETAWKNFTDELKGKRFADFKAARDKCGVRERAFHQENPDGSKVVIVTLEGENPEQLFQHFATATDDFNKWFIDSVIDIHGFDLSKPMQGPVPEMVVDTGK